MGKITVFICDFRGNLPGADASNDFREVQNEFVLKLFRTGCI